MKYKQKFQSKQNTNSVPPKSVKELKTLPPSYYVGCFFKLHLVVPLQNKGFNPLNKLKHEPLFLCSFFKGLKPLNNHTKLKSLYYFYSLLTVHLGKKDLTILLVPHLNHLCEKSP